MEATGYSAADVAGVITFPAEKFPVTGVTFRREAVEISRSTTFTASAAGRLLIEVDGIPAPCHGGVRGKLEGDGTLLGVSSSTRLLPFEHASLSVSTRQAVAELYRLKGELSVVEAKTRALAEQRRLMQTFSEAQYAVKEGEALTVVPSAEDLFLVTEFLQTESQRIDNDDRKNELLKGLLTAELNAALQKLQDLLSKTRGTWAQVNMDENCHQVVSNLMMTDTSSVQVLVEANSLSADLTLSISYEIARPSWIPSYDLHMGDCTSAEAEGNARLHLFADIDNKTLEPWNNVSVALSTVCPTSEPPHLPFKKVRVPEPKRMEGVMAMMSCVAAPAAAGLQPNALRMRKRKMMVEKAPFQAEASVSHEGLGATYVLPGKFTLTPFSGPTRLTIFDAQVPMRSLAYIVPSQNVNVFHCAEIENNTSYPWVSSNTVSLYRNSRYCGKARIGAVATGGATEVNAGLEKQVDIKIHPKRRFKKGTGVINKFSQNTEESRVDLKNVSFAAASEGGRVCWVASVHSCPLPLNESISVTVEEPAPLGTIDEACNIKAAFALVRRMGNSSYIAARNVTTNHIIQVSSLPPQGECQHKVKFTAQWPAAKVLRESQMEIDKPKIE